MANLKKPEIGTLSPGERNAVMEMRSLPCLLHDARMIAGLFEQLTRFADDASPEISAGPALNWLACRLSDRLEWMAGLLEAQA